MKIYTSYWAMVRNFPINLVGLNSTIYPPRWRELGKDNRGVWVIDCPPLKPGAACNNLCNGKCSPKHPQDCKFLKTYKDQLDEINFNEFINHLTTLKREIEKGENISDINFAIIFFETPSNLCSERIPLQQWFRENGVEIEEWKK